MSHSALLLREARPDDRRCSFVPRNDAERGLHGIEFMTFDAAGLVTLAASADMVPVLPAILRLAGMRKTLYEGKFIRLMDDDGWEFADRVVGAGVVCIVAIDGEHVLLVEEFRRAVQAPVISLPAGLIDRAEAGKLQETAIEAALRELREETGYTARSIEQVASGPISAGMTTERLIFFLAQDLAAGEQKLDGDEDIKVHRVPLERLSEWLGECASRGTEIDPKIFAGLYFVKARGLMTEAP